MVTRVATARWSGPATRPAGGVVTGVGLALPGIDSGLELLAGAPARPAPPIDPAARLGRKGLRYKDRASVLALCAAADALRAAGLLGELGLTVAGERIGVVAATETGPIQTVCAASATLEEQTVTGLSPMDLPNASPNVIASTIAIRFGLRGVTMLFTNGPSSGLDALRWAATLLAARRLDHVLVVGVEVAEPAATDWLRARGLLADGGRALDGAVAVVVEAAPTALRRGAPALGVIGRYARRADAESATAAVLADSTEPGPPPRPPDLILTDRPLRANGTIIRDVGAAVGVAVGALGVVQCAAALSWLAEGDAGPVLAVSGPAAMMMLPAAGPRSAAGSGTAVLAGVP